VARGLPVRPFPIFLSGALDTKTDPRLVPAGSMLEIENMFYQRTGELRLRNGFATLTGASLFSELCGLWSDAKGKPVSVGKSFFGNYLNLKRYGNPSSAGWKSVNAKEDAYPAVTCERITGTSGETETANGGIATASAAPVDGDVSTDGTFDLHTWLDANMPAAGIPQNWVERRSDALVATSQSSATTALAATSRPPIACVGGTGRLCTVSFDTGNGIYVTTWNTTGNFANFAHIVAGAVDAAAPWIDAKAVPGGNSIVIAYKLTAAGGVGVLVFDVSTNAITIGPVTIAAADATQALGFLDDSSATGSCFLVTAGATSGVVCRTLNLATLAVTTTDVIDATATTNVRQVTGHTSSSATNYHVFWDVAGTPLYYSKVRRGRCVAGVTTLVDHSRGVALFSRSFKANDGRYYLLTAYDSATQPMYLLFLAEQQDSLNPTKTTQWPLCAILPGVATGRRANQSSLASAYIDSSGRSILSVGRKTSVSSSSQDRIALSFGQRVTSRELGGAVFSSGGIVMQDDGYELKWGTILMYPESLAAVSTAGGSMTATKTYSYVAVIAENDALGNRIRSAKSVPTSVVIAPGQGSATLTVQNPRTPPRYGRNQTIEIYRAGPAEDGSTGYNKVGETYSDPDGGGNTLTFVDTLSDAVAQVGETLYSTGNVLENFVTPSTKLIEVCGGRLWLASAETPDELWPSKQFKAGAGVNFNPLLSFRVTGDGYGKITALAAMDGRLIVFKSGAIYAITGDGPNDLGQGSFNPPQAASLANGTTNPASVVATPDGIMFQSTKGGGLWLLDRGLGLTYAGQGVEQYTLSASIVGASLVNGTTQVRFVLSDGRCLVLDYSKKTAASPAGSWSTFLLRVQGSTVVACADIPSGWCYACADGRVYQETPGVFSDVNSVSTIAIIPAVTFPILAVGGINGFARLYAVNILGEYVGDHTLSAALTTDYDLVPTTRTLAVTAATGALQLELKPTNQKGAAYRLRLTSAHAAGSGAFRLSAVTLWAGVKRGGPIPDTKRIP
jgi:hypothetical protein